MLEKLSKPISFFTVIYLVIELVVNKFSVEDWGRIVGYVSTNKTDYVHLVLLISLGILIIAITVLIIAWGVKWVLK